VSEGLPISILEAMAAGLPILSTRVGGMVEIGELMPRACELVPLSDPEAMAAAICRLSADRSELPKRGAVALECYREYFTPAQMAQTYMNIYRGCRLDPKAPVGSPASMTAAGKVPK
jgi:glycosyltransferase involved in cell wall biosynthesis